MSHQLKTSAKGFYYNLTIWMVLLLINVQMIKPITMSLPHQAAKSHFIHHPLVKMELPTSSDHVVKSHFSPHIRQVWSEPAVLRDRTPPFTVCTLVTTRVHWEDTVVIKVQLAISSLSHSSLLFHFLTSELSCNSDYRLYSAKWQYLMCFLSSRVQWYHWHIFVTSGVVSVPNLYWI